MPISMVRCWRKLGRSLTAGISNMMVTILQRLLLLVLLLLSPSTTYAFTKVLVQAVYKEWTNGKPHWVTDPAVQKKHNFTVFAYQKLDPNAPNYFGYNRGTETGVYLKYIVDHYDNFPDVAIFVHAKPHEHQSNWLHMVGCISPNATWYNINYGQMLWTTRNPDFWEEDGLAQEQCWRDVLQIIWELKGKDEEFRRRLPPTQPIIMSATCCNQFLISRDMIRKRPLHVWKELLQIIAMQPMCHMGEPDYENLFEFNRTGRVKLPEKPYYEKFGEWSNNQKGAYIPGLTGEHLNHVIFGHKEFQMKPPTQEEMCQNFIRGCPGSPCKGPPEHDYSHMTFLVKAKMSVNKDWFMVLHKSKRHNVPDMDTLDGLDVLPDDILSMELAEVKVFPEGPPLTPCDKTWVPNTCKDSVFYKALHNMIR